MFIGVPFLSKSEDADGNIIVEGKVTDGSLDLDRQIVDPEFADKALTAWASDWGNLRQMHATNLPPAGLALTLDRRTDGHYITGKIVEPTAKILVKEGVYKAFSIGVSGPRIIRDVGAAKGRIVDGTISEVSLVDYPANPSCRFQVVKRAPEGSETDFGDWEYLGAADPESVKLAEATLTKAGKACPTCKGSGKIMEGNRKCPDCKGSGTTGGGDGNETDAEADVKEASAHPEVLADAKSIADDITRSFAERAVAQDFLVLKLAIPETAKRDFSDEKRQELADSGAAMPDGSFPIETKGDLENAVHAYGRSKNKAAAKRHIIQRAKDLDAEDMLPDGWVGKVLESTFAMKRLHDALCPCYTLEQVEQAYPAIEKNGVASTLGPTAVSALYEMLVSEVTEDAGTGKCGQDIGDIAKAYEHLCRFINSELWQAAMSGEIGAGQLAPLMMAARADLRKAFQELNGLDQGTMIPLEGPIQPGRFKRPYITSGHYREEAGPGARIPSPSPIDAGNFDRSGMVAGEERDSPANKDLGAELWKGPNGRVFYTNTFRDNARATMASVHDHIAATFPELCATHADTVGGDALPVAEKQGQSLDNNDTATLETPTLPAESAAIKSLESLIAEHPGLLSDGPLADMVQAAIDGKTAPLLKRIDDLKAEVEKVSGEPDPGASPMRVSGVLSSEAARVEKVAGGGGAEADGREGVHSGETLVDYIQKSANSADPSTRENALAALERMGVEPLTATI